MFPVLKLFGIDIPTYPIAMILGYVLALWVLMRLSPRTPEGEGGIDRGQVWDLFIVMVVSSVLGSKIGHTLFEAPGHLDDHGHEIGSLWELLQADPWHWMRLGEGGYVWYGGMIGALSVAVFYFWRRPHLNAWRYSDLFAPAIMAGAFVGRIGCFLAGCCYGQPTSVPWGVSFPRSSGPVHPTQLYDFSITLVLGVILFLRYSRRRFDGEVIALLLILYPVLRSATEMLRGDADRGAFGPLSTSQLLSIPLLAIGVWLYSRRRRAALPA